MPLRQRHKETAPLLHSIKCQKRLKLAGYTSKRVTLILSARIKDDITGELLSLMENLKYGDSRHFTSITKDLPKWFWADFGHIDCEKPEGACVGAGLAASTPLVDSTTVASQGVRREPLNSKWSFYRLRGTQIGFASADAVPTVLSNPVIEATFQRSSCITCHAYATVGLPGKASDVTTAIPNTVGKRTIRNAGSQVDLGEADCRRFAAPATDDNSGLNNAKCISEFGKDASARVYVQTDFLWSIPFRAFSANERP